LSETFLILGTIQQCITNAHSFSCELPIIPVKF